MRDGRGTPTFKRPASADRELGLWVCGRRLQMRQQLFGGHFLHASELSRILFGGRLRPRSPRQPGVYASARWKLLFACSDGCSCSQHQAFSFRVPPEKSVARHSHRVTTVTTGRFTMVLPLRRRDLTTALTALLTVCKRARWQKKARGGTREDFE